MACSGTALLFYLYYLIIIVVSMEFVSPFNKWIPSAPRVFHFWSLVWYVQNRDFQTKLKKLWIVCRQCSAWDTTCSFYTCSQKAVAELSETNNIPDTSKFYNMQSPRWLRAKKQGLLIPVVPKLGCQFRILRGKIENRKSWEEESERENRGRVIDATFNGGEFFRLLRLPGIAHSPLW
jgi:hypothetical protein